MVNVAITDKAWKEASYDAYEVIDDNDGYITLRMEGSGLANKWVHILLEECNLITVDGTEWTGGGAGNV